MRIAFVGDICLDADGTRWCSARLPDLHRELGVDRVVANFEAVVGGDESGESVPDKICLSVARTAVGRLAEAGVDLVSVANNHSGDYGADAFGRSLACLRGVFGERGVFGATDQPTTELAPGLDVLGVCFPETRPRSAEGCGPLLADSVDGLVSAHRASGRALVVFAHWGEEQLGLASPEQRAWARTLTADGASQIVGCHAHVVGSGEDIGEASVLYSLGNFIFRPMHRGGTRALRSNKRSAAVVYEWDGEHLRYERWMDCRFDARMNLSIRPGRGRFPGGWWERTQLALPDPVGALLYSTALGTRSLRVGAVKVLTGVERPTIGKLGTAARLVARR